MHAHPVWAHAWLPTHPPRLLRGIVVSTRTVRASITHRGQYWHDNRKGFGTVTYKGALHGVVARGSEGVRHDYCDRGRGEPRFINNSRRAGRNMSRPPTTQARRWIALFGRVVAPFSSFSGNCWPLMGGTDAAKGATLFGAIGWARLYET